MSMSFKASPDGTYGEILVNGAVVAKLPVSGNAVIPGLVGTVSQSGGIPTGAVVERGSNANGEYVRFADGTQICFRVVTFSSVPTNSTSEAVFSWPASFASAAVRAVGTISSLGESPDVFGVTSIRDTDATSGRVCVRNGAGSAQIMAAACIIIGRWF